MMLKLPVSRIEELFAQIDGERALYLPVEANGLVAFGRWAPGLAPQLGRLLANRPVKDFFFPQTENLATFRTLGKEIRIEENRDPAEPFAVFGLRPCDAESVLILDRVFLSDPVDTFYQARRQNSVLITLACSAPEESCFCAAFGIDAADPGGDIATWIRDGILYCDSRTDKGEALTARVRDLFMEADGRDREAVEQAQAATRAILDRLPLKGLDLDGFGGDNLM